MTTRPSISLVMPVYNAEAFLGESLDSVFLQERRPEEVIAVDDGSTDASAGIAESFGPSVRVLRLPHAGADAARNEGVRGAAGDFVAFLDADDVMLPGRLKLQAQALERDPGLDLVFGHLCEFSGTRPSGPQPPEALKAGVCAGTLMIRRSAFLRIGFFETGWKVAGFMEWYFRVLDGGFKSLVLPEAVLYRRIHGGNLTFRENAAMASEYARVIAARRKKKERPL